MLSDTKQKTPSREPSGFAQELRTFADTIPFKTVFAVLLLAWIALFQFVGNPTLGYIDTRSMFGWMQNIYVRSTDDSLGYLIPLVVVALLWWKREELAVVQKRIWWPALGLFAFGLFLHVIGYTVQQTRISVVGFFLGLYAIVGLIWGWQMLRATFFPFFLFAFMVPLPFDVDNLTLPLRILIAKLAVVTSHVIGIDDLVRNGTQLLHQRRGYHYDIEAACSGLRSLMVMIPMSCIFGFVFFQKSWKRGCMVLSAIPFAIVSNLLRLLSVVIGGTWKYDQMEAAHMPKAVAARAGEAFGMLVHDHAVLRCIPYVIGFSGMIMLARLLGEEDGSGKAASA